MSTRCLRGLLATSLLFLLAATAGCGPRVVYAPASTPETTVVVGSPEPTVASNATGPAGSVANASGRWMLVCCRDRLVAELALSQEGAIVRGILTSRGGNAVPVSGRVDGATLALTTDVPTPGLDRIDGVLDPASGTLTGSLSSREDASIPGGAVRGTRTSPAPAEAWIVVRTEAAPTEEACPAMGCAYTPCPPGVEPPTGCAAVCGCTGMPAAPTVVLAPVR